MLEWINRGFLFHETPLLARGHSLVIILSRDRSIVEIERVTLPQLMYSTADSRNKKYT